MLQKRLAGTTRFIIARMANGLIIQTAIRRIGWLDTAFVRLLITKALVVVKWHSSGFPCTGFVKPVPASLHPLHVTPKPCRLRRQLLHRHPDHHSRTLLVQFVLTPKSRRELAAIDPADPLAAL